MRPRHVRHGARQRVVLSLEGHVLVEAPHADPAGDVAGRHPLAVRGYPSHGDGVLVLVEAGRDEIRDVAKDDAMAAGVGDERRACVPAQEDAPTSHGRGRAGVRARQLRRLHGAARCDERLADVEMTFFTFQRREHARR